MKRFYIGSRKQERSRILNRFFSHFACANSNRIVQFRDKDLTIADITGLGILEDGINNLLQRLVGTDISNFTLGTKSIAYSVPRYISV